MKTIYYNGVVYPGELPLQEAFVVEDGKFIFCGSDIDALAYATAADKLENLEGAFVCSGFIDSHMHLLNYGYSLDTALLGEHTRSLADMLEYLRVFASSRKSGDGWIVGRGWNQDYFEDEHRMPTRWDLDQVSDIQPVMVVRACGHCLVLNSKAIELIGVTEQTPCPDGGSIGVENGVLDGRLYDTAIDMALEAIPAPGKAELKRYIENACRALNSYGVTACHSDDLSTFSNVPWQDVKEAFEELEKEGKLSVRVYQQSHFSKVYELKKFIADGNVTGSGTDLFRIGPLKLLGDGSLGARTAYLTTPYEDDPGNIGFPIFTQQEFDELIDCAVGHGMQVAVHCIGDACLDSVLSAYEKAFAKYKPADHRCGIVHCQITRPDQLKKMIEMNLHIYAQSIFLDYDIHIVEPRVGRERASSSYSWKTLMKGGLYVSNGTDCPVELPNALGGIQCAVTRCTLNGDGPYLPDEAFTVQEALDSYTLAGAHAAFAEEKMGAIKPGMLADFVILDSSPFSVAPDDIKDITVCKVCLGGNCVFQKYNKELFNVNNTVNNPC